MISVFDFVFFSLQNRIYTLCQISVFAFLEKEKKIYSHLNLFMAFSKICYNIANIILEFAPDYNNYICLSADTPCIDHQ